MDDDYYLNMYLDYSDMLQEVRDEKERLQAENAKLRELLIGAFNDMNAWQRVIADSDEWGYGKGCFDRLCELRDAMQKLGMGVEV